VHRASRHEALVGPLGDVVLAEHDLALEDPLGDVGGRAVALGYDGGLVVGGHGDLVGE
jgi:hypothetical protein